MSLTIDATAETLMRQAGYTAEEYMRAAVDSIDGMCGKGYAKKTPELIAAFMQTAACDYQAASDLVGSQKVAESIREISESILEFQKSYDDQDGI